MLTKKFYLYCFLDDLMLIYPFYILLFAGSGLSNFQISVIIATWSVIGVAMEVPSGVWADRYDRRRVLAVATVMKVLGLALWVIEPNFWGFLIGLALWGVQGAMISGTFEALLFDVLKAEGEEERYVVVEGRSTSASFIAVVISAGVAALAVRWGYDFLLWASILVSFGGVAAALWLPSAPKSGQVEDSQYFVLLRAGISEAFSSRLLVLPIVAIACATAFEEGFSDFVSLFSADVGLNDTGVAVAYMIIVGAGAVGGFLAGYISEGSLYRPVLLLLLAGVVLFIAASLGNRAGIGFLALYFLLTQASTVISGAVLQSQITGPARATVTSVSAFLAHIGNIGIYLAFGLLADTYGRFVAFAIGGVAVAVLSAVLLAGVWRLRLRPAVA